MDEFIIGGTCRFCNKEAETIIDRLAEDDSIAESFGVCAEHEAVYDYETDTIPAPPVADPEEQGA